VQIPGFTMPVPNRPTVPTRLGDVVVQLTDDGSRTLLRTDTNDAYHSGSGALTETRHVYLSNSGVEDRLRELKRTAVLEIGLGTGMGMLVTLDAACQSSAELDYVCFENHWLPADLLRQLQPHDWVGQDNLVDRYLDYRESLPERVDQGTYTWQAGEKQSVTIHHTDVRAAKFERTRQFDAVYFDPFAPDSNAELWQHELLSALHFALVGGGRLVTYCVSRPVRELLTHVGFDVQRVAGPEGGKREVLIATKPA
jgi:tRNA U34 5-methylaminomethyl-2-thiouridine-forming methyltransferase MnmC